MTRMLSRSLSPSLWLLALQGLTACASEVEPKPEPPVAADLQQVLDEAVTGADTLLPGTIAHYRDPGFAPWSGGAGVGDMQEQTPIRPTDQIRAGSILKTFLATVTLQHVEEGTLSLDQTLPELLPRRVTERVKNADTITLRMLLSHRSGIPEWETEAIDQRVLADPGYVWSPDEILNLIADEPALFEPGTAFKYSNTNYTLVGLLLDRLGEGTWREQVKKRVLDRLALHHSHLPEPGDRDYTGAFAHGYQEVDGEPMDLSRINPSMAGAAGGHALITTVADLARFLEALLDGQLFTHASTLEAMTTLVEAENESGLPYAYGLGLESYDLPGSGKFIGHAGGAGGYAVMMYQSVERGGTLVTAVTTSDMFTNALNVFMPAAEVITQPSE